MRARGSLWSRLLRWLWLPERVAALEARVAKLEAVDARRRAPIHIAGADVAAARAALSRLDDQSSGGPCT